MAFSVEHITRENIRRLKPYASAKDELPEISGDTVFLDANEQPSPLPGLPDQINRYPRRIQDDLQEQIALLRKLDPSQLILGNGSDEIIDMLMRCFARPGTDKVVVFPPTFGMYGVCAAINDLEVVEVPLDSNFRMDTSAVRDINDARLVFVCNPNNPTGNIQNREELVGLIRDFPGLVIVDEAYIDFAPGESLLPLLNQHPNLVVLQTFSKAWGLAGARVGVGFASREIISVMKKIKAPYNIGLPAGKLAIEALSRYGAFKLTIKQTIRNRSLLEEELLKIPDVVHVYPSNANFLLVKTKDAEKAYRHLASMGVVVRNRSKEPGCEGCLRITIGNDQENLRLLNAWWQSGAPENKQVALPSAAARSALVNRKTSETDISISLVLNGQGVSDIDTGIGFFNHMLDQIARHGKMDLHIIARGDLDVDSHHTIEDTGIVLGQALKQALGNKRGIERYGYKLPMDEASAETLIDLGGRAYFKWDVGFQNATIGEIPASLFKHFFRSFSDAANCNLHIKAEGEDDHHTIEAVFKSFARALRMAAGISGPDVLPTTKGML